MSSISGRHFVEACLAGEALDRDVDDWVDNWHDSGGAPMGLPVSLAEYLGMTEREYSLWVEEPHTLRSVIAARMLQVDLDDLVHSQDQLRLAARTNADRQSVLALISWLKERGDLPQDEMIELD